MKRNLSVLLTFTSMSLQLLSITARGHHSSTPFYDAEQTVEIQGIVTNWAFVNPHPFLYVEVAADDGKTQEWIIEFAGPVRLQKAGWSNETFQPGEMITAVGNPSKAEGTYGMFSPRITRW